MREDQPGFRTKGALMTEKELMLCLAALLQEARELTAIMAASRISASRLPIANRKSQI
jgi:hypothetical protein